MGLIEPDLTQYEEMQPIVGTFPATIKKIDMHISKEKGTRLLKTEFAVETPTGERKRTSFVPIEGAGVFRLIQLLRATNHDTLADQMKPGQAAPSFDSDILMNQRLSVVMKEAKNQDGSAGDEISRFLKLVQ